MKLTVPSSGSTIHRRPLVPGVSAPSSPMIASSGARSARTSRIACSASRSASLTRSVGEDFVSSARSEPNRSSRIAPAARTASSAIAAWCALN
jgi:hypothetical protein